jgi:SAM-dependent methyltransferase
MVFANFINELGFGWRNLLRWKRRAFKEPSEGKNDLWQGRDQREALERKEARMIEQYSLKGFHEKSSRLRYVETLSYLDFIEQLLPPEQGDSSHSVCRWLDVGVKNWAYVDALYGVLKRRYGEFFLTGIEIDPYRIYSDLYSRWDYAQTYIRELSNTCYLVGDVMEHQEQYDIISSFLPFVFIEPCLSWGLPKRLFIPEDYLRHLIELLKPGGLLLIINQGEDESMEQERLFKFLHSDYPSLQVRQVGVFSETFMLYKFPRYGWVARKDE